MPAPAATPLFHFYRSAAGLALPLAYRKVAARLAGHGVPAQRRRERLGHATEARPDGQLVWFHAASVGESLAALTLIFKLSARLPEAQFLLTSGTATSAEMAARRMPDTCRHQYAPLDAPGPVRRFLDHWRPDAGIFVESELWPVTLTAARKRGMPLALVNARLSPRSIRRWQKQAPTAEFVLDQFTLFLSQNARMADDLRAIGAPADRVKPGGNLKAAAAPLPADENLLAGTRAALGPRPAWIASSTHAGEEGPVLAAHKTLLETRPGLCLVLIPRHPDRGDEVEALVRAAGLSCCRRSKGEDLEADTQVYLADTLGETGTWYALSPIVFLGGSLEPIGGHNPFEVAQSGAAVITGPGYHNFTETFPALESAGGAVEVHDAATLAAAVDRWLAEPDSLAAAREAAGDFARTQAEKLEDVAGILVHELGLGG